MPDAARFLRTFVAVAAALLCCGIGLTAAVDPTGLLHMRAPWFPRLCSPGVTTPDRDTKPLLIRFTPPREILLGTSRVAVGFAEGDAHRLLEGPVLNLGVHAATLADVHQLLAEASAAGRLRRAWIGLDFGMFQSELQPPALERVTPAPVTLVALRHGLADPRVVRRAVAQFVDRQKCNLPRHTVRGFLNLPPWIDLESGRRPAEELAAEAADREWRLELIAAADSAARARLYRSRLRALEGTIDYAQRLGVRLVLFLNPSDRRFQGLVDRTGLRPSYDRWRADTAALARRRGVVLVDLTEMGDLRAAPACARASPSCDFFDLTHYRPHVGRYILRRGLAATASGAGTRP